MSETARSGKRSANRQAIEADILKTAEEIFARYGFHGATTAMIAEAAGLPKSNLHYYFNTKEILYLKVLENILELWLGAADELDTSMEPAAALEHYIRSKLDYSRDRPHASKVWANEIINGAPFIDAQLRARLRPWVASKAAVLRRWADEGRIDPISPEHLLFLIWSATQHYADFERQIAIVLDKDKLTPADFTLAADQVVQMVLKGIGLRS